ncbi:DNA/RNA-binding protein KIN17 [Frankliniella fusca]|uniref:DNA/RNA-binding protein KIN17 n=1 Tax=Frankliniella fusca TaxID=407009 RepID=A0AAE1LPT0_9NEOP|nr:DNA/RNA-binding protein KIN17 [Frankliniella fusca]
MGKHEVGTPKYIANKIKAKGLQKLRWYCQMCQKQCRDENGFKCHMTSESHQRQLLLFADNASKYLSEFSKEFADGYLELLRRQFGTKRVPANRVYQDYIAWREHIHMNATQWETLTEFVKWLGREGKCVVDETEKGWFVTYIDRDPATIALQEAMAKKEKMDRDDQDRMMQFLEKQIERGKGVGASHDHVATELVRPSESEQIRLNIALKKKEEDEKAKRLAPTEFKLPSSKKMFSSSASTSGSIRDKGEKRKASALDDIIKEEENRKENAHRKPNWLTENIVVKVMTKSLGDKYYKQKGVVITLKDKFSAVVRLFDSNVKLKLDQAHLETVIPAIGRQVLIVNGAYRGNTATLEKLDTDKFCATVKIDSGPLNGRVIPNIEYEDISKLHSE